MNPLNNQQLVQPPHILSQIAQGNKDAFRKLFDLYYHKLFHLALYFLKSKELAEESVSDVFFIIWQKKEELPAINNIEKYLYTSVKNQALQYIRRNSIPESIPLELYTIEIISDANTSESSLLNEEYQHLVQEAINSLPVKCREVFRLVLSDKLKHKEIASLLDISEKTVEAHVASAYKRIAIFVNKEYDEQKRSERNIYFIFI